MEPYCEVSIGNQANKTSVKSGKKPQWGETLVFITHTDKLKLTVMDRDIFNDKKVGEGILDISGIYTAPNTTKNCTFIITVE